MSKSVCNRDTPPIVVFDFIQARRRNRGKPYLNQDLIRYIIEFCYEPKLIICDSANNIHTQSTMNSKYVIYYPLLQRLTPYSYNSQYDRRHLIMLNKSTLITTGGGRVRKNVEQNERIEFVNIESRNVEKTININIKVTCMIVVDEYTIATASSGVPWIAGGDYIEERIITIWDIKSGTRKKEIIGSVTEILCLGMLNKTTIVSAGLDSFVKLWDIESGDMIKIITNDYEFHDDSDDSDDSDDGLMNNSAGTFDVYCIKILN